MEYINDLIRRKDRLLSEDEAMSLLENGEYGVLSVSENAKYALLLAQAQDKAGHQLINDSLILIAINHYDYLSKDNNKSKAYFYLVRLYHNNNDYIKAIKS